MKRTAAAIVLLAGVACAALASVPQDHVVIYRCTDASGGVTLQNDVPCPPGAQEQRQTVDVPPPLPAYTARETRMPAVVEEALCRSWQRRIDEAEFRWKFARGADDAERRLEYETLAATYRNSTCSL